MVAGVLLLSVGSPATAMAARRGGDGQPGVWPDPTFGVGGRAFVPLEFERSALWNPQTAASTPDGGLVLGNDHLLERLTAAGQVDALFGNGGTVALSRPVGGSFEVGGIAVDSQGRIVVAGTSKQPEASGFKSFVTPLAVRVERYLPDGSPDQSFGANGIVETDFGFPVPRDQNGQPILEQPWVQATGVAVDAQDRIVLTGGASSGWVAGCEHDWFGNTLAYAGFVARLAPNGRPDPSFGGGDGVAGGLKNEENALDAELTSHPTVGPGGTIAFEVGPRPCPRTVVRFGIAHLNEAGEAQPDFGTEGAALGNFSAETVAPDGSTLALEWTFRKEGQPLRAVLKRLQPNGAPDPSFGQGGSTTLVVRGGQRTALSAVTADSAGRVLVGGSIAPEPSWRKRPRQASKQLQSWLLLERLTPSGQPDSAFAPGGRIAPRFRSLRVGPPALLLDRQGRALLVSRYHGRKKGVEGLAVARFLFR